VLQKGRKTKLYKERPEIMAVVKSLALDHSVLSQLSPSYVSSFTHVCANMKIEDEKCWFSIVEYIASDSSRYNLRELATIVHSLAKVSKSKPVILNFDDLYMHLELSFVKQFDSDMGSNRKDTGLDLMNTLTSYSRTQNGSVQFFRALEGSILASADRLSSKEIANIVYTYYKAENAEVGSLLPELKARVIELSSKFTPMELCLILTSYTEADMMDDKLLLVLE